MPRPRTHDLDRLMDAAEALAVESGAAAVTVRALSGLTAVSNGAIYHAFESRTGLLGRVWLRAAQRFLTLQRDSVDAALARPEPDAIEAVVVAADTPARFLLEQRASGQFLLTVRREQLFHVDELPAALADEIRSLDTILTELFVRLARAVWNRTDAHTVDVIRDCVVELPSALLLRGHREPEPVVRERLAAAVRAVLHVTPPIRKDHR